MADIEDIAEGLLARLRAEHPAEADDVLAALVVGTLIAHLAHPEGGPAFASALNQHLAHQVGDDSRVWQLVELGADQVHRLRQAAGAAMQEAATAPRN